MAISARNDLVNIRMNNISTHLSIPIQIMDLRNTRPVVFTMEREICLAKRKASDTLDCDHDTFVKCYDGIICSVCGQTRLNGENSLLDTTHTHSHREKERLFYSTDSVPSCEIFSIPFSLLLLLETFPTIRLKSPSPQPRLQSFPSDKFSSSI